MPTFQNLEGDYTAASSIENYHSRRRPVLLSPAHSIKELKSMRMLLAPLNFCHIELKVFVRYQEKKFHRELEG